MTPQDTVIDELRRILAGPDLRPNASIIDFTQRPLRLAKRSPYRSKDGQEILRGQRPSQRYGIGVLFPSRRPDNGNEQVPEELDLIGDEEPAEIADSEVPECGDDLEASHATADDLGDEIVHHAHDPGYRPSSIGLSFLVSPGADDELVITVAGGRYEHRRLSAYAVLLDDDTHPVRDVELWQRHDVSVTVPVQCRDLFDATFLRVSADFPKPLTMEMVISARRWEQAAHLLTVTLINRAEKADKDQRCLFQAELSCEVRRGGRPVPAFLPYPEYTGSDAGEDEDTIRLWYRDLPRFATGHGCAADWTTADGGKATHVFSVPLPVYRHPVTSPDVPGHAPTMLELAGEEWRGPLERLVEAYEHHCSTLRANDLEPRDHKAAQEQIRAARTCADRMRRGLRCLDTDAKALKAFQLASKAMRLQQIAWRAKTRTVVDPSHATAYEFCTPYRPPSHGPEDGREPSWRAFQIAFVLLNIPGITQTIHEPDERLVVDLIWFPTGGGKTEAYLGLAAFAMLYERLMSPDAKPHVQVLMRYTMRLLTAQQFQRTAGLACALEYLRNQDIQALGRTPFRLGVWVGSAMTPNTRRDAVDVVSMMKRGQIAASTLFVHNRCPWCAAEVGTVIRRGREALVLGVRSDHLDATLRCSDPKCPFFERGLPLDVVDEHVLLNRPSLLIATVDKFALLPKKPELRVLFGIGENGHRSAPPPQLIIQDELHLICDALGSMVGAYEPLLHALCVYEWQTPPKVVCSTATVRTYRSQLKQLFARDTVALFPPPELGLGTSFFAPYCRDQDNEIVRDKAFVGVFGAGFPSFQTSESRTMAALLQAPLALQEWDGDDDPRDPYWTLVDFFSSIRELSVTHTLARTQISEALNAIAWWRGLSRKAREVRNANRVVELTARRRGAELSRALAELERTRLSGGATDICLATSIVEVGIDVGRLSLMCVVGQPKQFSTYIQATGRVGRRHPGVVVVLYDHTRARDRSVYEHFRACHERMHASVEPTTLTPFAFPVQERAVAAVLAGAARLLTPTNGLASDPRLVTPDALHQIAQRVTQMIEAPPGMESLCWFIDYLQNWVRRSEPDESPQLQAMLRRRLKEWRDWHRPTWHVWSFLFNATHDDPMMLDSDPMAGERERAIRWYVPNSMRDVDSESQLWIRRDMHPAIPGENDEMFPH